VRRHDAHRRVPDCGGENLRGPGRRAAALTDREQRADECADHVVAEGVGDHPADGHPVRAALPVEAAQRAHGGRALPLAAERGEVVLAGQRLGGLVHRGEVERARIPQGVVPPQRIRTARIVAYPVGVPPPQSGEPRVESVRRRRYRTHPHVRRQRPGQPAQCRVAVRLPGLRRHVSVRHLPPCVHAGVGPPGHGEPRRLGQPEHVAQRLSEHSLDGPASRLRRPPGEPATVIGEIDPYPDNRLVRSGRRVHPLTHRLSSP